MNIHVVAAICLTVPFRMVLGQPPVVDEHKPLHWNGAGSCLVDFVNTPCRTVRYHEFSFGQSLGFDRTTKSESVEAVDHEGSESKTRATTWHRLWLLSQTEKMTELVLRNENKVVVIDHDRRLYATHRGANRKMPYWEEDDADCSHAASHFTYLSGHLPNSIMAGVNVVGYSGRDGKGADYEIYFAPSIGCQQMRFQMVMKNLLGWTTAEYDMIVDSYVLGTPAASLFSIPSGYQQVPFIPRP